MATTLCVECGTRHERGYPCPRCTELRQRERIERESHERAEELARKQTEEHRRLDRESGEREERLLRQELEQQEKLQRESDERARVDREEREKSQRESDERHRAALEEHAKGLERLQEEREEAEAERLAEYEHITANADRLQAEAKVARGYDLELSELYEEALALYKQALNLDPSCYTAYHRMMCVYIATGQHGLAKDYARKCFKLLPHSEFRNHLSAIVELRRVAGIYPDDDSIQSSLHSIEASFGNYLRENAETLSRGSAPLVLAADLARSGFREEANEILQRVLTPRLRLVCRALSMGMEDEATDRPKALDEVLGGVSIAGELHDQYRELLSLQDQLKLEPGIVEECRLAVMRRCEHLFDDFLRRNFHAHHAIFRSECESLVGLAATCGLNLEKCRQAVVRRCEQFLEEFARRSSFEDRAAFIGSYEGVLGLAAAYRVGQDHISNFRQALAGKYAQWRRELDPGIQAQAEERAKREPLNTRTPAVIGCLCSLVAVFVVAAIGVAVTGGTSAGASAGLAMIVGGVAAYLVASRLVKRRTIKTRANEHAEQARRALDRDWAFLTVPVGPAPAGTATTVPVCVPSFGMAGDRSTRNILWGRARGLSLVLIIGALGIVLWRYVSIPRATQVPVPTGAKQVSPPVPMHPETRSELAPSSQPPHPPASGNLTIGEWITVDMLGGLNARLSGGTWHGAFHYLEFTETDRGRQLEVDVRSGDHTLRVELWRGSIDTGDHSWWEHHTQEAVSNGSGDNPELVPNPKLRWTITPGSYTVFFAAFKPEATLAPYTISYMVHIRRPTATAVATGPAWAAAIAKEELECELVRSDEFQTKVRAELPPEVQARLERLEPSEFGDARRLAESVGVQYFVKAECGALEHQAAGVQLPGFAGSTLKAHVRLELIDVASGRVLASKDLNGSLTALQLEPEVAFREMMKGFAKAFVAEISSRRRPPNP